MRVLLISANTEQLQMPVLPLGLACVATAAEKAGHEVRFLNLMTTKDLKQLELENAISGFDPEVVGISARNIDDQCMNSPRFLLDGVRDIVSFCRRLTSAPVVLGGAGYSIFPGAALAFLGADMGIKGEGEDAFVRLLDRLSRKDDLSGVPNLVLADPARQNEIRVLRALDNFALPDPAGMFPFPTEFQNQKIWLPFQTRRGCPMECSYCSTATIEGRILRKRSPETVVGSIAGFVQAGFEHFYFVDNTFNLPPSYARELCDLMIARNLHIQWRCILYPWRVEECLIERMARAGCVEVSLGFESGSSNMLRSLNKKYQLEEVRSISKMLAKYQIGRMGFLLLGGPGETRKTVHESFQFADSLDLEALKITAGIRIYPNTALAETAVAEGVVSPSDDLLRPTFYLADEIKGWIEERISDWLGRRPNWQR
jgi:radical SAM superfamily enzyme YgiQ (UPF0313 family)